MNNHLSRVEDLVPSGLKDPLADFSWNIRVAIPSSVLPESVQAIIDSGIYPEYWADALSQWNFDLGLEEGYFDGTISSPLISSMWEENINGYGLQVNQLGIEFASFNKFGGAIFGNFLNENEGIDLSLVDVRKYLSLKIEEIPDKIDLLFEKFRIHAKKRGRKYYGDPNPKAGRHYTEVFETVLEMVSNIKGRRSATIETRSIYDSLYTIFINKIFEDEGDCCQDPIGFVEDMETAMLVLMYLKRNESTAELISRPQMLNKILALSIAYIHTPILKNLLLQNPALVAQLKG